MISNINWNSDTILYAEMFDRVGRARFEALWNASLVELGVPSSAASDAVTVAKKKANEVQSQHKWVDTWLAHNGFIDPRQPRKERASFLRKAFEKAFHPEFDTTPENGDYLDYVDTDCGYAKLRAEAKDLQILADTPWDPKVLPVDQVKAALADEPRPYLAILIDLMAFGGPPPNEIPAGKVTIERRRAAIALFEGVRRAERPILIGTCGHQVDQSIPQHYFDTPRMGHQDSSISIDQARLSNEQYSAEFESRSPRWSNVRVEAKWFMFVFLGSDAEPAQSKEEEQSPTTTTATITLEIKNSHKSRAMAASIDEVFPDGVPVGTILQHVKNQLEKSSIFKIRGLSLDQLKAGSYDSSLKRMLGFT